MGTQEPMNHVFSGNWRLGELEHSRKGTLLQWSQVTEASMFREIKEDGRQGTEATRLLGIDDPGDLEISRARDRLNEGPWSGR